MKKLPKNEEISSVIHEHRAVRGSERVPVLLRVRYEKENMEAFLSAVSLSKEKLEMYEREALYEGLKWAQDHPGQEEAKAGDVLMVVFWELLMKAEHPLEEPLKYGLKIHREREATDNHEDCVRYSISL